MLARTRRHQRPLTTTMLRQRKLRAARPRGGAGRDRGHRRGTQSRRKMRSRDQGDPAGRDLHRPRTSWTTPSPAKPVNSSRCVLTRCPSTVNPTPTTTRPAKPPGSPLLRSIRCHYTPACPSGSSSPHRTRRPTHRLNPNPRTESPDNGRPSAAHPGSDGAVHLGAPRPVLRSTWR
jgi:hypothetical protein